MHVAFEPTSTHVESGSWVTVNIQTGSLLDNLMDFVLVGIISYSLRDTAPSIKAVLLPFSKGKRLRVGKNSILVANYVEDGAGGNWQEFTWELDGYGEWECDDLPSN